MAMEQQKAGLTLDEIEVLNHLANAWNAFLCLEHKTHDYNEFRESIHICQNIVMSRVATRTNPEILRK